MKKILKGVALGGLALVIVLVGIGLFFVYQGTQKEAHQPTLNVASLTLPSDSASLAQGAYLTTIHGCQECHGANLEGNVFADAPPFRLVATNLTPGNGGIGATYTSADWVRAIRHGIGQDGAGLWLMPSELYTHISDEELRRMIAHLQTLSPVDNVLPSSELKLLGRLIAGVSTDMITAYSMIDHDMTRATPPPQDTTATYGAYRASTMCTACHAPDLHGAPHPDPQGPYSPDLVASGQWTFAEFQTAMRTGVTPSGRSLDPKWMPWRSMGQMTDADLKAVHSYLSILPPRTD